MVLFFTSTAVDPPATIYVGRDKVENEDLIKYGFEEDVWFHVDKLSSAHVYLRLRSDQNWENIPTPLLADCAQLVKANSIEGNKKNNITIIYTPWSNIKKQGDMAIGSVTFHNDRKVKRTYVKERENAIVNRLNKTKKEVQVDHEAVRQEREREKGREKKRIGNELKNQELAAQRQRQSDRAAKDYSALYSEEAIAADKDEKERKARRKAREAEERGESLEAEKDEEDEDDDAGSEGSFM